MKHGLLGIAQRFTADGDAALRRSLDSLPIPLALVNARYEIEAANTAFANAFVCNEKQTHISFSSCFNDPEAAKAISELIEKAQETSVVKNIQFQRHGFKDRVYNVHVSPLSIEEELFHVVTLQDATEFHQLKDRLALIEYRDRRTGLPNRKSLDLVLEKEIARVNRAPSKELLAVLFISLENFARINQTYGHVIGDILLENSGIRIKESIISELLRDSDYVFAEEAGKSRPDGTIPHSPTSVDSEHLLFRFDGKEFTALLTGITRETDAAVVATRISQSVSMPYRDKYGSEIYVNCNIGIAVYPNDGDDKETIIQHAASAMHEAKRLGEEFLLFNKRIHTRALDAMRLGGRIYSAFVESQFQLFVQPIVDYSGVILGGEALIRWNHPERGLVPPNEFIPLAEEKGMIVNIGKWSLFKACSFLRGWPEDIYISINISPKELDRGQLVENVRLALDTHKDINPRRLKIEITERDTMSSPEDTIRKMHMLTGKGVEIYIDDFGTGQSSLHYLKELPASVLKIDRSFITTIEEDEEDRHFLESIIDLAVSRGKKVIIEGVESGKQVALIRQMQPALLQGYYFSKPLPAEEFSKLVHRRARLPLT